MDEIAESIRGIEAERKRLAAGLRSSRAHYKQALEKELIYAVKEQIPEGGVCAVDGGLLAQEFYGFDLLLGRAVAVNFVYEHGKLSRYEYHPSSSPEPEANALGGLDLREFAWHQSLFRLEQELGVACEALEKFKPSYLLLDGSVAPQISDKPSSTSELREHYDKVIASYKRLYELAQSNKCALAGVIKDSRGKRFIEIVGKGNSDMEGLQSTTDTSFLHHLLQERERTFAFHYVSAPKNDPVLNDLGEWAGRVLAFYLRPTEGDRPLRVEFVEGTADHEKIAEVISWLSRINARYSYPAVLIEADMRAALDKRELDRAYSRLFLKAGGEQRILKLRRDERPFR